MAKFVWVTLAVFALIGFVPMSGAQAGEEVEQADVSAPPADAGDASDEGAPSDTEGDSDAEAGSEAQPE